MSKNRKNKINNRDFFLIVLILLMIIQMLMGVILMAISNDHLTLRGAL